MTNQSSRTRSTAFAIVAALMVAAPVAGYAVAQQAPAPLPREVQQLQNHKTLSLADLEKKVEALGFKTREIKVKGLLAEVEAFDQNRREVELTLDRRSGEVLTFEYDD